MKSRRRPAIGALAGLVVFLAINGLYFHLGLFPGTLREDAMRRIEQWTHKKVAFEKAVFVPFHGLSLLNVAVSEADGTPIFRARRVTLNARLWPFLTKKKIVINRCLLDGASYDWALEPAPSAAPELPKTVISGQISVPVVPEKRLARLSDLKNGPDFFLPDNVYVERIEIADGHLVLRADRTSPPLETVRSIDVRLTLPSGPMLRFEGRVELGETSYASVELTGRWDLQSGRYEFLLATSSQKVPDWLLDYQKNNFLALREGRLELETRVWNGARTALFFKTKASLKDALLQLRAARYSGDMRVTAEGVFDTLLKRFEKYRGQLELVRVNAENLSEKIPRLDDLTGDVRFEPDRIAVRSLRGVYKDIPFDASGSLHSFRELNVEGDVRMRLSVERALLLLPAQHLEKLKDFALTGDIEAHTLLSGSLRKSSRVDTRYKLVIRNGTARNDVKKILWTDFSGELRVGADGVHLENTRFFAGDDPHTLSAFIPAEAGRTGSFHLRSRDLDLSADYTVQGEDLSLKRGHASLPGASADFSGKCLHWSEPRLDIQGDARLDLERLLARFAKQNPAFAGTPLKGTLAGPFTLSGAWDKPLDWEFKMDAEGEPVTWNGRLNLGKLQVQIRMKDRRLGLPYLHSAVYGGTIGCQAEADLSQREPFFRSQLYLGNLDLSKVGGDLEPPKEALKGTLIAKLSLEGRLNNPATYRGEGAVSITNGLLWQTSQFKDMGNLPLVKVEGLDWVTFDQMNATFKVKNQRLHTSDLTLFGDSVDLSLSGTIGFDQSLDLAMNIRYSNDVMRGAEMTGGLAPFMVQQAGNYISQYRVSGTLKEPKYEKRLLPSAARAVGGTLGSVAQALTN